MKKNKELKPGDYDYWIKNLRRDLLRTIERNSIVYTMYPEIGAAISREINATQFPDFIEKSERTKAGLLHLLLVVEKWKFNTRIIADGIERLEGGRKYAYVGKMTGRIVDGHFVKTGGEKPKKIFYDLSIKDLSPTETMTAFGLWLLEQDQKQIENVFMAYSCLTFSIKIADAANIDSLREEAIKDVRRNMGVNGAIAKLANDPKQVAKAKVRECWNEWQLKPMNYRGKSAFAKDMMTKFEELDSQPVITRWCGQWENEATK